MTIFLQKNLGNLYKNESQKIRIITEHFVSREIFCPNCGNSLKKYENNKPVADFFCSSCSEDYELKSKKNIIGKKIIDGAYKTMVQRLNKNNNPNFFFLSYEVKDYSVKNFIIIPKHFFTTNIIEKRKPLSPSAKRHGWIGCNIILKDIPESGKIFYIKNKIIIPKEKVLKSWNKTLFLQNLEKPNKGWLLEIIKCIEFLKKNEFSLDEIYKFEKILSDKFPNNKHIKDKIRQQLQILRDKNFLNFKGNGKYFLTP